MADPHWLLLMPRPRWVAPGVRGGSGPMFDALSNRAADIVVEITTDAALFNNPAGRSRNTFYNSLWGGHSPPTRPAPGNVAALKALRHRLCARSITAKALAPQPVLIGPGIWTALARTLQKRHNGRLYYRAFAILGSSESWFLSGRPTAIVTTADSDASRAPYIEVTGVGDRNADARYRQPGKPSRATQLAVQGDRLVVHGQQGTAPPVVLRGVNFSGLQNRRPSYYLPEMSSSSRPPARAGNTRRAADIVPRRLREIRTQGANVIRLPVNQDWVLNGNEARRPLGYLHDIDAIVHDAAAAGLHVIVCNQIIKRIQLSNGSETGYIAPLPDHQSLLFWRILARRYRREPAVLFDLSNEPHRPGQRNHGTRKAFNELDHYTGPQPRADATWVALWHDWVRAHHNVVRNAKARQVIVVSGIKARASDKVSWAADLSSMPVRRQRAKSATDPPALDGLLYSSHLYPHSGTRKPGQWNRLLGRAGGALAGKYPVFIGEWGPSEPDHALSVGARWVDELAAYLDTLHGGGIDTGGKRRPYQGLAGWCAWSWGAKPHLVARVRDAQSNAEVYVADAAGNRVPTKWGRRVQKLLGARLVYPP